MRLGWRLVWVSSLSFAWLGGCGDNPDLVRDEDPDPGPPVGGSSPGSGGQLGNSGGMMIGVGGRMNASGGRANGGGPATDPCDDLECGPGQRCEVEGSEGVCIDNQCDDLDCSELEECVAATGGGNRCVSIACDDDVDCPVARYCDGEKCVDDACEPDTRRCDGNEVFVCASNGGEEAATYACDSAGYFESECSDATGGPIGCTCEDDWDCPPFTVCETGACTGTGEEPTCTLPPTPFEDVLPQLEFRWGGDSVADPVASDSPFAWSAQVATTPIVINLDDDNGDGRINELDFPEIVFISHRGNQVAHSAVVRAVHGGGANKGKDFFALCGTTHWFEGDPLTDDCDPAADGPENVDAALARPGGVPAAGDLDGDGFPEIVVPLEDGGFQVLNNRGEIVLTGPAGLWPSGEVWKYPAPAIANLDFAGLAEVIFGNRILTFRKDNNELLLDRVFLGGEREGVQLFQEEQPRHLGPVVCAADLTDDPGLELVAGTTLYSLPAAPPAGCGAADDPCPLDVVWDGAAVNGDALEAEHREGFCAVADILGADQAAAPGPGNAPDGKAEVIVIANGFLVVLDGASGELLRYQDLGGGITGGAPNVDDFDGDGFPEVATALQDFYVVLDLQTPEPDSCPAWPATLDPRGAPPQDNPARNPGGACDDDADCSAGAVCNPIAEQCVCLHNGWRRDTEDDSSRATSSSVFDFNGDGAAEVVYNDECYFRVYDGASGQVHLALPSLSRTLVENPVVADIDNDGNAEIVFGQNSGEPQCGEGNVDPQPTSAWGPEDRLDSWPDGDNDVPKTSLPNGLEVWGDPSDVWVAARRVWNQHAYHVTNVTEAGGIPVHEPESWLPLNGRVYNTYRSQPRNYGVAPDLALTAIQISSPDVACGELSDEITITVEVENQGDLRVGPGVILDFFGIWSNPTLDEPLEDGNGDPISLTLDKSLEPGASTLTSVTFTAGANGRDELPDEVRAVIDGANAERECNEDNNTISAPIEQGEELADLRLVIDSARGCTMPRVEVTVHNDGSAPATEVLVRVYAGDPSSGGTVLGEVVIPGPIEPGESASATVELEALTRDVTIWAIADPLDAISECNDANNVVEGPRLICNLIE
jgi:hypothetical protein